MAVKVNLDIDTVRQALNAAIASTKRAMNGAKPAFKAIHEQDLAALNNAVNTLQEVK